MTSRLLYNYCNPKRKQTSIVCRCLCILTVVILIYVVLNHLLTETLTIEPFFIQSPSSSSYMGLVHIPSDIQYANYMEMRLEIPVTRDFF